MPDEVYSVKIVRSYFFCFVFVFVFSFEVFFLFKTQVIMFFLGTLLFF